MSAPRYVDFAHDPVTLARRLLGQRLVRVADGTRVSGVISEVEAYLGAEDRAAHTFGGHRSPRNETMYAAAGHLYVYFIYGMHHCLNVVAGAPEEGVAVLLRAVWPEEGIETMRQRREGRPDRELCSGPGRLAAAFGVDRTHDGTDLRTSESIWIERLRARAVPRSRVENTPRIGIPNAGAWRDRPLRFVLRPSLRPSSSARGRYDAATEVRGPTP